RAGARDLRNGPRRRGGRQRRGRPARGRRPAGAGEPPARARDGPADALLARAHRRVGGPGPAPALAPGHRRRRHRGPLRPRRLPRAMTQRTVRVRLPAAALWLAAIAVALIGIDLAERFALYEIRPRDRSSFARSVRRPIKDSGLALLHGLSGTLDVSGLPAGTP